jgi:hypothetical protein
MITDWCCMCKSDRETIDHLFLQCVVARELWCFVFCLFGVSWGMPTMVPDSLTCWTGLCGKMAHAEIWEAILLCLMWTIWRERNLLLKIKSAR